MLLAAALAGCAGEDGGPEAAPPEVVEALADTRPMTWAPGNYWAYHATYRQNLTFDVALVVHESTPDGFRLGSNLSAGFFGLPFTGNVSPQLNPRIGPEEWPLYRFPLRDGQSWEYTLFGYDAKTVARAVVLDVPGVGEVPGFHMEASAYGQTFARYDYAPPVGWFTRLELIEPTDGSVVLDVQLRGFGPDFGQAYYVEKTIREVRLDHPSATPPGALDVQVPGGFRHVRAFLTAETSGGVVDAKLTADGRTLAQAQAVGKGVSSDRVGVRAKGPMTWRLEHKGVGVGVLHLEVTGLVATGLAPSAAAPEPREAGVSFGLEDVLHSTRPDRPHTGHATSTGWPVAV